MVIKKVWNSDIRKQATGTAILFDGNKLAWSKVDLGEKRMMIDLDAEQGRTGHDTSRNAFRLVIKKSKELEIGKPIQAYLSGQIQMDVAVLEAVNFLDHLLRENPSTSPKARWPPSWSPACPARPSPQRPAAGWRPAPGPRGLRAPRTAPASPDRMTPRWLMPDWTMRLGWLLGADRRWYPRPGPGGSPGPAR